MIHRTIPDGFLPPSAELSEVLEVNGWEARDGERVRLYRTMKGWELVLFPGTYLARLCSLCPLESVG